MAGTGKNFESIAALLVEIGDMRGTEAVVVITEVHSNPLGLGFKSSTNSSRSCIVATACKEQEFYTLNKKYSV